MNRRLLNARFDSRTILLAMILMFAFPADAWGCPNCREALAGTGRALGYAVSILLMMSAPFVLAGFWTTLILRLRRQAALKMFMGLSQKGSDPWKGRDGQTPFGTGSNRTIRTESAASVC